MKKITISLVFVLTVINIQAQVGIGNTNPDSSSILDITSSDKGVLVPRINLVNVTNLTAPINTPATGLLIWNTNASVIGGNGIGFYFYNGAQWTPIIQTPTEDHDFYEEGTTSVPNNINDDIYTFGNVAIGKNNAVFNLDVIENADTRTIMLENATTSGIISSIFNNVSGNMTTVEQQRGLYNLLSGSGNNTKIGVYNNLTGTSTINRHGIYNALNTDSDSNDHGIYNDITSSSITSLRGKYGTYNAFNNSGLTINTGTNNVFSGSASGAQYGTLNTIRNNGNGNHFGIRNNIEGSGSGTHYGISNQFIGIGSGAIIGYSNFINVNADGNHTGINNSIAGSGDGTHYGSNNNLHGTGTGYKYGFKTFISPTAGGMHFGVHSSVKKIGGFSGFFVGDVAIGTQGFGGSNEDHYILPASRGTNNQIMLTDGTGNVSWQDPSALGVDDHDFYEEGTTNAPNDINDDMYTQGNVAIGKNIADYALDIEENSGTRGINISLSSNINASSSGLYVHNSNTGNSTKYGIQTFSNGNSNGLKTGLYNYNENSGTGNSIGVYNSLVSISEGNQTGLYNYISNLGDGIHYGTYNSLLGTGTGNKYGTYSLIPTTAGGQHYGVYSEVLKPGSFAGYFRGNVSIGTTNTNEYILPSSRGTNNQIMQTDGSGNVSWIDTNTFSSDDQNLTGANLTGTTLQIDIEGGASTSVDLAALNYWSRTGVNLDVATAADDISFSSDQTSIIFPAPGATPSSMIYMFDGGFNNTDRMVLSHSPAFPNYGLMYEDSEDSFIFRGTAERVEIDLNSNFPLRVYGTARAVNFQSDTTTYPDYVFETYYNGSSEINKSYSFKPLGEIESYIKHYGHLPGVKSFNEIKEAGMTIDLGETSIKNLEKIEELFLYAIELKKENDELKTQQKLMEERLKKLEALFND